jgi:hypothetical protein
MSSDTPADGGCEEMASTPKPQPILDRSTRAGRATSKSRDVEDWLTRQVGKGPGQPR